MPITFPNGFNITSKEAIDSRLILSKEEMRALKKAQMPDKYLTICKDDGKLYLWDSLNELDPETGRFRLSTKQIEADLDEALRQIQELNDTLVSKIDEQIKLTLPSALKTHLEAQSLADSGLEVDEDGNIRVKLNEDHLQIIDNKIDLAISVIQAIDGND